MNEPKAEAPRQVYAAIKRVMEDMAKAGVGKTKTNTQQGFSYRGVDDVMDALAPSLSKHGLIIVPHVTERTTTERQSRNGGTLFHTLLRVDYDFICVNDGSQEHVGPIYGEAMDSGDKSTNKAMAVAYKYAAVQTFCIPITGADDPDAHTHEVAGAPEHAQAPMHRTRPAEQKDSAASQQPMSTAPARPGAKPDVPRPGGIFGYGRKFYDTPWNVMKSGDLEWFLAAERTPQHIRERIHAELSWREYETSELEAGIARQKAAEPPISDDVPWGAP